MQSLQALDSFYFTVLQWLACQQQRLLSEHAYLLLGLCLAITVVSKAISLIKVVGLKDCDA